MNSEAALITSICENKEISPALTAPEIDQLFTSHYDIWGRLKDYYYKHKQTPSVNRIQEWFDDFEPVEVDGPVSYYVDKLRQTKISEGMVEIVRGMAQDLDSEIDVEDTLVTYQAKMASLNKFATGAKDLDIVNYDVAERHYEQIKELAESMGGSLGIPTGFDAIDSSYHTGMAPGHFICIIGWPGHKKSFFSEELAIRAWLNGYKPMIISLEMTPESMRDRVYTLMAQGEFRLSDFSRGSVDIENFKLWTKENLADKQGFIIISNEGISDISPSVIQGKIDQYKPQLLVVDYLQLLIDNAHSKSEVERVRNISRQLKLLAVSNNIPVIAIISATSQEKKDRNSPPLLEQAAWSKSIEYDADMALAVHTYKSDDDNITEIVSRKNRHGDDFDFYLRIDPETGIIRETFDMPDWMI